MTKQQTFDTAVRHLLVDSGQGGGGSVIDDEFTGHTPGDWTLSLSDRYYSEERWVPIAITAGPNNEYVLEWDSRVDGAWATPADARLMAAAPRLLRERDEAREENKRLDAGWAEANDTALDLRIAAVGLECEKDFLRDARVAAERNLTTALARVVELEGALRNLVEYVAPHRQRIPLHIGSRNTGALAAAEDVLAKAEVPR